MLICDFTKPELDYFRENCNFVNHEIQVFELRSKGLTHEQIAENLHLSVESIRCISRKVNRKILKVI
jgi:transcriptional regulator